MDCSMSNLPVPHHLLEFAQIMSLYQWCHPASLSSDALFSFCLQSFPASGSFPMSRLFTSGDQNTGASASASILPKSIQGWFPLRLTGLIFLLSKGLSRVFFSTTVQKRQFFSTLPSLLSNSHNHTWPLERSYPWLYGPLLAKWCLCFMTLCLNKEKLSQLNIVSLNKSCEKNLKQNVKKNSRNLYDKN